jgi:hypothetical protein
MSFETSASSVAFPILLPQSEKDHIVHEFRAATSNASLKRYGCSFCGRPEFANRTKMRAINELDISLLDGAVVELRERSRQPRIESFQLSDACFRVYIYLNLDPLIGNSLAAARFSTLLCRTPSGSQMVQGACEMMQHCSAPSAHPISALPSHAS